MWNIDFHLTNQNKQHAASHNIPIFVLNDA